MRTLCRGSIAVTKVSSLYVLLTVLSPMAALGATVSLSPASLSTTLGSPITLDLNISGLGNGTALSGFDINVNFDSANLTFQSARFGDPVLGDQLELGGGNINGPRAFRGTGIVDLNETDLFDSPATLLSSQAHSFTLAVLSFSSIATGTTPITLTFINLSDQNGNLFTAPSQDASVTVQTSPVPLPSAVWLLISGLIGLRIAARSRRNTPTVA